MLECEQTCVGEWICILSHLPINSTNVCLSACCSYISRTIHLLSFTLGICIINCQRECRVEIGAIWTQYWRLQLTRFTSSSEFTRATDADPAADHLLWSVASNQTTEQAAESVLFSLSAHRSLIKHYYKLIYILGNVLGNADVYSLSAKPQQILFFKNCFVLFRPPAVSFCPS